MQTKLGSLWEGCVNVFIGYTVNILANLIILPLFGLHISFQGNLLMGSFYTVVSLARSYLIRRFFNRKGVMDASNTNDG